MYDVVHVGGCGEEVARAQVRAGRWQRVFPAVFCTYTGPLTFESRCAAALLHAGRGAALDGATAALIHGLRGFERDPIEVVVHTTGRCVPDRASSSGAAGRCGRRGVVADCGS